MSIKNIKASFILEEKVNAPSKNCIFKQDNVVYTIYPHFRDLVNVTGIKRFEQLEIAKKIPKTSEYPTILFFRTGSYTMMGAKKKDILIECQVFVNKLILMFNKHFI